MPWLVAGESSPCPETRMRVVRLLAPWRSWQADERARELLFSPWPVEPLAFWADDGFRYRVQRAARAAGCSLYAVEWLTPDGKQCFFNWGNTKPNDCIWGLAKCREELGQTRWPFK